MTSGKWIEEEVPFVEESELECERLILGWRRKAGSWFWSQGEAYWKKWSVTHKDDVDGQASETRDEQQVLRGGWTVMRLCGYEGWLVVRTFQVS